jgi:hypothetical protein
MQSAGGGGGGHAFRMENRGGGGGGHAFRMENRGGGGQAFQQRSFQRQGHAQRQSFAFQERGHGRGNATVRMERGNQGRGFDRQRQVRSIERQHGNRFEQRQVRNVERMHGKRFDQREVRNIERQRGFDRIQNREVFRNDFRGDRLARVRDFGGKVQGFGVGGCPPGLMSKGCMPPGQAFKADRIASEAFRESRFAALAFDPRTRFIDPYQATRYIGAPLSTINGLMAFPSGYSYLYPDTPDYYYRYGNGYLYEVDRDTSLISALLPLLGGGILPGQYLPNYYMSSYVPDYYGFNSFYPTSYAGYGYGYDNLCNRYANGVVYQVDCGTGFVEDVVPLYAGGYGVGQMLPAGYGYYNVPSQYRSLYYDTPDYNYWYAPGAIYQYDPGSSLITSVAVLLSPGFNVGQPLPMGYDVYNVPYAYRSTYYDTPNAWYRYNNGYIYQVDPTTQLVTAIVASILT